MCQTPRQLLHRSQRRNSRRSSFRCWWDLAAGPRPRRAIRGHFPAGFFLFFFCEKVFAAQFRLIFTAIFKLCAKPPANYYTARSEAIRVESPMFYGVTARSRARFAAGRPPIPSPVFQRFFPIFTLRKRFLCIVPRPEVRWPPHRSARACGVRAWPPPCSSVASLVRPALRAGPAALASLGAAGGPPAASLLASCVGVGAALVAGPEVVALWKGGGRGASVVGGFASVPRRMRGLRPLRTNANRHPLRRTPRAKRLRRASAGFPAAGARGGILAPAAGKLGTHRPEGATTLPSSQAGAWLCRRVGARAARKRPLCASIRGIVRAVAAPLAEPRRATPARCVLLRGGSARRPAGLRRPFVARRARRPSPDRFLRVRGAGSLGSR